jgi:hypothetical protein
LDCVEHCLKNCFDFDKNLVSFWFENSNIMNEAEQQESTEELRKIAQKKTSRFERSF